MQSYWHWHNSDLQAVEQILSGAIVWACPVHDLLQVILILTHDSICQVMQLHCVDVQWRKLHAQTFDSLGRVAFGKSLQRKAGQNDMTAI